MKRLARRLAWVGVALCVVALAFEVTERLLWRPGATEANVRRIQPGMTLAAVEELLGGPATEIIDWQGRWLNGEGFRWQRQWREKGATVDVFFHADGTVFLATSRGMPQSGYLDRLRSLLGW